jgi:hypothetical protein
MKSFSFQSTSYNSQKKEALIERRRIRRILNFPSFQDYLNSTKRINFENYKFPKIENSFFDTVLIRKKCINIKSFLFTQEDY